MSVVEKVVVVEVVGARMTIMGWYRVVDTLKMGAVVVNIVVVANLFWLAVVVGTIGMC